MKMLKMLFRHVRTKYFQTYKHRKTAIAMNLDELKPLWKSYQDQVNGQDQWNKAELAELLKAHTAVPWYSRSSRVVLNLGMCIVLIGINGC